MPAAVLKMANRLLSPCFLIYAYKDNANLSFEKKIVKVKSSSDGFLKISGGHSMDSKIIYFLLKNSRPTTVLKFPRSKRSTSIALEETRMSLYNKFELERKDIDSVPVYVEPFLEGENFKRYDLSHNMRALDWLLAFQNTSNKGIWDSKVLINRIVGMSNRLLELGIEKEIQSRFQEKIKIFINSLSQITLPITAEHGDFSPTNIQIKNDSLDVMDWEFYEENGDPLFDFIFFILDNFFYGSEINARQNTNKNSPYKPIMRALLVKYARARNLPVEFILQAFPYVIMRCLYRNAGGLNDRHIGITYYCQLFIMWDQISEKSF